MLLNLNNLHGIIFIFTSTIQAHYLKKKGGGVVYTVYSIKFIFIKFTYI